MRLTFLGTGSAMPTGERSQTGLLLEADDGDADGGAEREADDGDAGDGREDGAPRRLLVDCGSGVLNALAATDVGYVGVDTVLLTHHHLDHVADLLPLLKARWLAEKSSLTVLGPPGTPKLVGDLLDVHAYLQDRVDLTLRAVEPGAFSVAGFDVRAMETRHSMYCLAYRFGDALAFSGDTAAFADLAAFADGVEAFVHDCSFPDGIETDNHPTPATLGEAFAGNEYGTVYLTHLYPHTDGAHDEMRASIARSYDGAVRFARDGLAVQV